MRRHMRNLNLRTSQKIRCTVQTRAVAAVCALLIFSGLVFLPQLLRVQVQNSTLQENHRRSFEIPCLVLTQNVSKLHRSLRQCTPFVAPAFQESELDFVSIHARKMLLDSSLLQTARDLSNNASVNIYMNHARMWAMVLTRKWDLALLLEDDVIIPEHVDQLIAELVTVLNQNNASNFVVKLVDHWVAWQWKSVHTVGVHDLRTCACKPAIHSSSSAAYLIDKHAAQTLLDNAFPASMHVDSYTHDLGCNRKELALFQIYPHLVHYTNRPSTHMQGTSPRRAFLLMKEIISNTLSSTC